MLRYLLIDYLLARVRLTVVWVDRQKELFDPLIHHTLQSTYFQFGNKGKRGVRDKTLNNYYEILNSVLIVFLLSNKNF